MIIVLASLTSSSKELVAENKFRGENSPIKDLGDTDRHLKKH